MIRTLNRRTWIAAVFAAAATYSGASFAAGVDAALQGAILGKALSYSQTLKGPKPNVLVVGAAVDDNAKKMGSAFEKGGANVRVVSQASADANAARWADAIYVLPGQLTSPIRDLCTTHRLLSLSGEVGDVEAGRASVAVGVSAGKPQIVINLGRVEAEGHKLSARLLKLARIVR